MSATPPEQPFQAQFGEDRLLEQIFAGRDGGYCVEVGAHDGRTGSASYLFERRGWRCLLVEPIPALVEEIRRHRDCVVVNAAASSSNGEASFFVARDLEPRATETAAPDLTPLSTLELTPDRLEWIERAGGAVEEITVRTARLDSLLEEAGFPEVQFITIDVEGHELAVLEGLTLERYRPRVVIIEDNSVSGDAAVARHMSERGYVHFRRTGVNEWYAHESDGELIVAAQVREFERAKARERWARRRRRLVNRVATAAGRHLPDALKRPLRSLFERVRPVG